MKVTLAFVSIFYLLCLFSCLDTSPNNPSVAFRIAERDLIPECIGYSSKMNSFYLTSIHKSKIIRIDKTAGTVANFIESNEHGFMPGIGLWIDEQNSNLWAIASDIQAGKHGSRLFLFDLNTSELKKTYEPPDSNKHFLNDLVITESGDLYVTDSDNHAIYQLNKEGVLSLFLKTPEIAYPNGITYSPLTKHLFVASFTNGIRVIDIATKQILNEKDSTDLTRGIDGLKYYNNTLIGIQNGFQTKEKHRIIQYSLDRSERTVRDFVIIEENNQYFDTPTTFVIKDDELFCIANSQLSKLDQTSNTIINSEDLDETIILRFSLDSRL